MINYLKIQSKGEIEMEAFTLIGASSKRNDISKIGYFGSGLKYSIAALLRNNIDFKIFQGEKEIEFNVVEKEFRGETYKAICVNNQETSMTTTMGGSDWDIPFAPIREIYSNALDEDEDVVLQESSDLVGESGFTTIYIDKTKEVCHFFENFTDYFCDKNPNVLSSNQHASVYPATTNGSIRLFRKGILCYHREEEKSLFVYNSEHFEINESRILSSMFGARGYIAKCLKALNNKQLIKDLIEGLKGGNTGYFEHKLDFTWNERFSAQWYEVCKDLKFVPAESVMFAKERDLIGRIVLPKSLLMPLFRQFDDLDILGLGNGDSSADYIIEDTPSIILLDKVTDAMNVLLGTDYKHRLNNIDIKYAVFIDKKILGLAENGKIILSTKLADDDIPYIAKIIIEENEHNISECEDETRGFQNHLFKLYFDQLTRKH